MLSCSLIISKSHLFLPVSCKEDNAVHRRLSKACRTVLRTGNVKTSFPQQGWLVIISSGEFCVLQQQMTWLWLHLKVQLWFVFFSLIASCLFLIEHFFNKRVKKLNNCTQGIWISVVAARCRMYLCSSSNCMHHSTPYGIWNVLPCI